MDLIAISGLILTAAGTVAAYLAVLPMVTDTRKRFAAAQPIFKVVGCTIISAGRSYAAYVKLHNPTKVSAYDAVIALDGCPWEAKAPVIHPLTPGRNEYEERLELGEDSQVRTTEMKGCCLRIHYRDRWGYGYDLSYPVKQTLRADGRFNIQIATEQPSLKRPKVGFLKMRKLLREIPSEE